MFQIYADSSIQMNRHAISYLIKTNKMFIKHDTTIFEGNVTQSFVSELKAIRWGLQSLAELRIVNRTNLVALFVDNRTVLAVLKKSVRFYENGYLQYPEGVTTDSLSFKKMVNDIMEQLIAIEGKYKVYKMEGDCQIKNNVFKIVDNSPRYYLKCNILE